VLEPQPADVVDKVPKAQHAGATDVVRRIPLAETAKEAARREEEFAAWCPAGLS
jgi:hypothetical protein